MLAAIVTPTSYDAKFGFVEAHWLTILAYADAKNAVIFFRSGKGASIPWIEKKFPAKYMAFKKSKVDPQTGLLIAKTPEQLEEVAKAGHWLLKKVSNTDYDAYDPKDPKQSRQVRISEPWARENLVIDSRRKNEEPYYRPFTSDYDLAAVLPLSGGSRTGSMLTTSKPGNVSLTRPQVAGKPGLAKPHLDNVANSLMDKKAGYSNAAAINAQTDLNTRFADERIVHGPQALYSPATMSASAWALTLGQVNLASGDDEQILAFTPEQKVHAYYCRSQADSKNILMRYLPV